MADDVEDEPQWLQDHKTPVMDPMDIATSSSDSKENSSRRRPFRMSDSEEENVCDRKRFKQENAQPEDVDFFESCSKENAKPENIDRSPIEVQDDPPVEVEELGTLDADELDAQPAKEGEEVLHKPGEKKSKPKMTSAMPLMFADRISRSKVLLECEGDALDLSGDMGAVGRISVSGDERPEVYFDLKGTIYSSSIMPCNSYFLVNIGATEAKVEAVMNDFVQLKPDTNINDTETMIEGTIDGITFDSDDEGARMPPPPTSTEEATDQRNVANKGKAPKETGTRKPPRPKVNGKVSVKRPSKRGAKASSSKRGASKKLK